MLCSIFAVSMFCIIILAIEVASVTFACFSQLLLVLYYKAATPCPHTSSSQEWHRWSITGKCLWNYLCLLLVSLLLHQCLTVY